MKVQKRLGQTVAAGAEHPLARRETEGSQAEPVSAGVPDSVPAAPPGAPACPPRLRSRLLPPHPPQNVTFSAAGTLAVPVHHRHRHLTPAGTQVLWEE